MPEEGGILNKLHSWLPAAAAGGAAGLVNGFFGGGGGMVLVPLLMGRCGLDRRRAFANSVAIILPLCPDKGTCLHYDPNLSASVYLENDLEQLLRQNQ